MICPNCDFENELGSKFCNQCGNNLQLRCPGCDKMNQPGSKFCKECGQPLESKDEVKSVDYKEPQSYTPKHLADKILTSRSSIEGERKLVTVLFADIANFTSISEKLDPEEVHQIMDGCFKILMDEIHKYEGTINQFTGDGVMALFGAPVAHEDHAQRSCHAALSIQKAMEQYSDKIKKETGVTFKLRIGINSGPVVVGAIGDDLRMDYTAIGDTTNLGSRIESNAMPGGILTSENTYKHVQDYFEFNEVGKIKIKGKKRKQKAFELIKIGNVQTRIEVSILKGLTKFVGRKNSIGILSDAFAKAKSGSGQVVGILGEAGVGKSRLLLEMRRSLPPEEFTYLEGHCRQYGGSISYLPFLEILKSYFSIKEGDREFVINKKMQEKVLNIDEKLKTVIPPFQYLLSLAVEDSSFNNIESTERREKIFESLRDLFIRASQERPMIITVEDLHWIDQASEDFLNYLVGWIANVPILLITLYRPEYTHQWGSKSYYSKIGLVHLGNESSEELVKAILAGNDAAPGLKNLIIRRSSGNPLFMEEFTHSLLENGSIEKNNNIYVLSGNESDIQIPDTIQGIIAARLDRLEENLKRTMQVASVIGRDFMYRILQTITGMQEELKSHLLNLQGLEFIYEKRLFPELEYIFKHAITQEVAYNSLLLNRRKEIHEKIGITIEEIYGERLDEFYEVLAYHYFNSNNHKKGAEYSLLAAKKSVKLNALVDAIEYSTWVVICYEKEPITTIIQKNIVDARSRLARYYQNLGCFFEAKAAVEPIIQIAENLPYHKPLPSIYSTLGQYELFATENYEKGKIHINKALSLAEKSNDFFTLYDANYTLGILFFFNCQYEEAIKYCDISLKLSELAENPTGIIFAKAEISMIHNFCGNMSIGYKMSKEIMQMAEQKGDPFVKSAGFGSHAISCYFKGLLNDAEKYANEAYSASLKTSNIAQGLYSIFILGEIYYRQGNYKKAGNCFKEAVSILDEYNIFPSLRDWYMLAYNLASLKTQRQVYSLVELSDRYKNIKQNVFKGWASNIVSETILNSKEINLVECERWIHKSIKINKTNGTKFHLAYAHILYSGYSQIIQDYKNATIQFSKAIDIYTDLRADGWTIKYEKESSTL